MPQPAMRRGVTAGANALLLLAIAGAPARVAGAYRSSQSFGMQILWAIAGLLRDLAAALLVLVPIIVLIAAVVPWAIARTRARWQFTGTIIAAAPGALVVWLFGVAAEEFKVERGAYPTLFDLSTVSSSAVFLKGTLGFLRYDIYWIPAVIFWLAGIALVIARFRRPSNQMPLPWRPWATGFIGSLVAIVVVLRFFAAATASARVGDPFQAIIDSGVDLVAYGKAATPRELVRDADLPDNRRAEGAALLGWPATKDHARPLDDAHGLELVRAFEEVSKHVFAGHERDVIVWQLTLESFRADDLQAINGRAAREIAPFVNGLYESGDVLASRATYQAGVRTAQGLGALACGLGTLPYNLSLIRDLHPMPVRCLADVLHDAGFRGSFYYGSDGTFDGMDAFYAAHCIEERVTQAELPKDLPQGAWSAVSDLALMEETTKRVAEAPRAPRYVMLTTISNHSPFAAPSDLPPEVTARVDHALEATKNHALSDDRKRLLTFSYTDAAVERFFARLDQLGLAARSIVVLSADHSTGENYLWGTEEGSDTDDARARIPFAIVLPPSLRGDAAARHARELLASAPLSQNDIPSLVLALLTEQSGVRDLPKDARWHTLGGQVTSPWFKPVATRPGAYVMGINGVSQFLALDRKGERIGDYEESVFLKTRSDRTTVTPSLVPITATLSSMLREP
jgi:hypothetical protein